MRKIFAELLLSVIWNSTVPADILAQSERFLGAWTLVEWTNVRDGEIFYPYGEDPIGQIVYTESGRMTAVLMPSPVPGEFPSQFVGYWGGFSVQSEAGTVTHHVEGSHSSRMRRTDQVRYFRFEGADRLVLSPGGDSELTWARVR